MRKKETQPIEFKKKTGTTTLHHLTQAGVCIQIGTRDETKKQQITSERERERERERENPKVLPTSLPSPFRNSLLRECVSSFSSSDLACRVHDPAELIELKLLTPTETRREREKDRKTGRTKERKKERKNERKKERKKRSTDISGSTGRIDLSIWMPSRGVHLLPSPSLPFFFPSLLPHGCRNGREGGRVCMT